MAEDKTNEAEVADIEIAEDFMFQLTMEEVDLVKSQNATANINSILSLKGKNMA